MRSFRNISKKSRRIIIALIIIPVGVIIGLKFSAPAPLAPLDIRSAVSFPLLVPHDKAVVPSAWKVEQGTVTYKTSVAGQSMVVTLQQTPLKYRDDTAAYEQFIGSLRPAATFKVKLGRVYLINLVQEEKYTPSGQSAILMAKGTLLVAHPEAGKLSDDGWLQFFDALIAEH